MIRISAPLVENQIPEHLVSDSPIFVDFVKTYFKYADQITSGGYQIQNSQLLSDIDLCDEPYIDEFFKMYGEDFPKTVAMDRRNFLKILNSIYEAKATEKSVKLAFRLLFGEEIEISYPGDDRLIASDGIWVREKYVTLDTEFGTLPPEPVVMSFSTNVGDYTFETTRNEILDDKVRCYFQSYTKLEFAVGQRVYRYDVNGSVLYAGTVVESPSFLVVRTPGKNWQIGQVFMVPGSVRDTIAKVTSVDTLGGITGVEIIEYGAVHTDGQLFTVSPYPNKPNSTQSYVESILTNVSPVTYHHTMHVNELVLDINETVIGSSTNLSPQSYFAEDYVVADYVAHIEFIQSIVSAGIDENIDTGGLTIEEWLASRATLSYEFDPVVQLRGYYKNERGQLSNQTIKMQDNYFYQTFSYLIETSTDMKVYQNLMKILHPVGTKRFAELQKKKDIDLSAIESEIVITSN